MPAKNSRKIYAQNSYYHLYNRGVEKRVIFDDQQDYSVFLGYLKEYLTPRNEAELYQRLAQKDLAGKERNEILKQLQLNNFHGEIDLLCFALMPNHFHLLVKQHSLKAIDKFLNSLMTRYVMFFNQKRQRTGHLFQGVYKAVLVESEEQLLHLSRYIHRNPLSLTAGKNPRSHQNLYSSLPEYLGRRKTEWVKADPVLSSFSGRGRKDNSLKRSNSYRSFVEERDDFNVLKDAILDEV